MNCFAPIIMVLNKMDDEISHFKETLKVDCQVNSLIGVVELVSNNRLIHLDGYLTHPYGCNQCGYLLWFTHGIRIQ